MALPKNPNIDYIAGDGYSFKKEEVFKYFGIKINSMNIINGRKLNL